MRAAKKNKQYGTSQWALVWQKLCENKFALASFWLIIAVILIAIFAPLIAPYDYAAQDYNAIMVKRYRPVWP